MRDPVTTYLDNCRKIVAERGWMIQGVLPCEHSLDFSYTAGLCLAGLPELVMVGFPPDLAGHSLNEVARRAMEEEPHPGDRWPIEREPSYSWAFGTVSTAWREANVVIPGRLWPDRDIDCLQLIWPDDEGHHPSSALWSRGDVQPLLAEAPDDITHDGPHDGRSAAVRSRPRRRGR